MGMVWKRSHSTKCYENKASESRLLRFIRVLPTLSERLFSRTVTPFVEIESVTKTFGGTRALDGVTLALARGEIHALMGENGAGKSTLGKILAGIHNPDSGTLRIDGEEMHFASPRDSRRAGIGMVHQELACCPDLSVAENLAMGGYPRRAKVLVDHAAMKRNIPHVA